MLKNKSSNERERERENLMDTIISNFDVGKDASQLLANDQTM